MIPIPSHGGRPSFGNGRSTANISPLPSSSDYVSPNWKVQQSLYHGICPTMQTPGNVPLVFSSQSNRYFATTPRANVSSNLITPSSSFHHQGCYMPPQDECIANYPVHPEARYFRDPFENQTESDRFENHIENVRKGLYYTPLIHPNPSDPRHPHHISPRPTIWVDRSHILKPVRPPPPSPSGDFVDLLSYQDEEVAHAVGCHEDCYGEPAIPTSSVDVGIAAPPAPPEESAQCVVVLSQAPVPPTQYFDAILCFYNISYGVPSRCCCIINTTDISPF